MLTTRAEILVALGKESSITDADLGLLDMIHKPSEAALLAWLQSDLSYQQFVEYYPAGRPSNWANDSGGSLYDQTAELSGNSVVLSDRQQRRETLALKNTPVWLAGLEVREDIGGYGGQVADSFGDATVLTLGGDYYLDVDDAANDVSTTGLLRRVVGDWPTTPRSVKVTYYGGLTHGQLASVKAGEVKLAAIRTVIHNFWSIKNSQSGGGPKISETIGRYSYARDAASIADMGGAGTAVPASVKNDLFHRKNLARIFG